MDDIKNRYLSPIKLDYVPKYTELNDHYGKCNGETGDTDPDWKDKNIVIGFLPFPLRMSWKVDGIVTKIALHRKVIDSFLDAMQEIKNYKGVSYLMANGYDIFGGGFCNRIMRGSNQKVSTHAWGIAVDLNPQLAPYGEKVNNQPAFIVEAFEKRGWVWRKADYMHVMACRQY